MAAIYPPPPLLHVQQTKWVRVYIWWPKRICGRWVWLDWAWCKPTEFYTYWTTDLFLVMKDQ